MSFKLVIGAQWGDEGKGKIIDALSSNMDYVIRFNGGNNAGHTVINEYGKFPMHLIPCGIFAPDITACISNGVVINLEVLISEIDMLTQAGILLKGRLWISPRCHLILPYHSLLDTLYEKAKGKNKTGTTGRGIGPAYADKVSYNGIRLSDFIDEKKFSEKLRIQLKIKNKIIRALGGTPLKQKNIEKQLSPLRKSLSPFIKELYPITRDAAQNNKSILFEGAHAVFLDTDWGTYPYVTASSTFPGAMNTAVGLPVSKKLETIGIVKAYTTRVGAGPFPTELFDVVGEQLRNTGHEFGTTTGRPRRCGWFDAELVHFAAEITDFSSIALTKLDILDQLPEIKICIGYTLQNKKVSYYDGDEAFLEKVTPVYKTMKGWQQSIEGIRKYIDLPLNARKYIEEIEKLVEKPIKYISTGPARQDLITRK